MQEALDLAADIYEITRSKPFSRGFGLCDQIQRAVVSISSNIAEGDERSTNRESVYFFNVAKGSSAEVITQLKIAHRVGYIDAEALSRLEKPLHFKQKVLPQSPLSLSEMTILNNFKTFYLCVVPFLKQKHEKPEKY